METSDYSLPTDPEDDANLPKMLRNLLAKQFLSEEEENVKQFLLGLKAQYDASDTENAKLYERVGRKSFKKKVGAYFDFEGNPISMWEWSELRYLHSIIGYNFVNGYTVSTVYRGIPHGWDENAPLIFETMIFAEWKKLEGSCLDEYQERYTTEEQAFLGHIRAVQMVMNYI